MILQNGDVLAYQGYSICYHAQSLVWKRGYYVTGFRFPSIGSAKRAIDAGDIERFRERFACVADRALCRERD